MNTRSQIIDEDISVSTTVASLPIRPATRSVHIYCLLFGKNRELQYPDHYFCSNCKKLEERNTLNKTLYRGNIRTSNVYKCQAGHTSSETPTTLKSDKLFHRNKRIKMIPDVIQETIDLSNETKSETTESNVNQIDLIAPIMNDNNNNNLMEFNSISHNELLTQYDELLHDHSELLQEKNKLQDDNIILKDEMKAMQQKMSRFDTIKETVKTKSKTNYRLQEKVKTMEYERDNMTLVSLLPMNTSLDDFLIILGELILKLAALKNRVKTNLADRLVEFLWSTNIIDGCIRLSMIESAKKYFRTEVYSAPRIMELLDMHGGQLSYEGIDLLRQLETNGEKYVRNTIIPHSSSIKRVCYNVDKFASLIVPFEMGKLENGKETAEFKAEHVLPLLYKGYRLEEIAKTRPISINQSIDATQITQRQNVTVWGLKMSDVAAIDPKTGNPIYGTDLSCGVQSRNNCFPLKMAMDRESNVMFNYFRPNMEALKYLTENKLGDFHPIKCAMDCDLSATWKLLLMGGSFS